MKELIKVMPKYRVSTVNKKKTHEEYATELATKNPTVEVIGKYIDAKTKITHRCLTHDVYWDITPSNALKGRGCKDCRSDKIINKNNKTHEQYVKDLEVSNPNIIALGRYINSKTPILHKCLIHNIEWNSMPSNMLKGYGCEKCKKEKIINYNLKSHEQYVEELKIKNPHIKPIEIYINIKTPILHYCSLHNTEWKLRPTDALQGHGCKNCWKERIGTSNAKLHNDYVYELSLKNPHIKVIGEYINCKTSILHYCSIHNINWYSAPIYVLNGCGCPECQSKKISTAFLKTHQEYVEELREISPNVIVLEQYINMKRPIMHYCSIHNFEWNTTPASTLQGCGCPQCKSEKIMKNHIKSHEQYIEELKKINSNIMVLEQYNGAHTPILHQCLTNNHKWYVAPTSILSGYGCPQCNGSKGEKQIQQWLDNHKIMYNKQYKFDDCQDVKPLPFDFYLPDYNVLIEYDGKQHFEPVEYFGGQESFEKTVKHDNIKNEYCKNNGIQLLRIPYYKNVEEELNNFLFI